MVCSHLCLKNSTTLLFCASGRCYRSIARSIARSIRFAQSWHDGMVFSGQALCASSIISHARRKAEWGPLGKGGRNMQASGIVNKHGMMGFRRESGSHVTDRKGILEKVGLTARGDIGRHEIHAGATCTAASQQIMQYVPSRQGSDMLMLGNKACWPCEFESQRPSQASWRGMAAHAVQWHGTMEWITQSKGC